jgi:hypothetical protein
MEIQCFVFNYAHFEEAKELFDAFTAEGLDTYLLNCKSPHDPDFEETDKIKKFPNIYYSGQWNEALKLLTGDVIFITNSDVRIRNYGRLINRMRNFYEKFGTKAGLYAPNHYWTPWTYNPALLEDVGSGMKKVPATDSTIWSLCAPIARKVGPMDLGVNKLGWGIEILAAYYCSLEGKLVVRDYAVKCDHPRNTAYDRGKADREWRTMIEKMKLGKGFWDYYNSRDKYGFGWVGKDDPSLGFDKMLL